MSTPALTRDPRRIRATYYLEVDGDPQRAAEVLAGEQSSGTFVAVPGESDALRERHGAQVVAVTPLEDRPPSLPSRGRPQRVRAAEVTVEWPMENTGTDLATLQVAVAGNLFELGGLHGCRLLDLDLPPELVQAHAGPAFGVAGTRELMGGPDGPAEGVLVGTIIKPNVGLDADGFRTAVRELARAGVDLIKDDELMTDPTYLPLSERVRIGQQEIDDAAQTTGRKSMYAYNITGDLAGLRHRHDLVVAAGGTCVMLAVPVMGIPALEWLRSFSELPIHGHRAGLAALMRHPALGISYAAWQLLARLAGADHLHVSGLGSKFSETDDQVAENIRALQAPLGTARPVLPTLSSGQNVRTPSLTWGAVPSTDLLMLAGGGIIAHPDGPGAGVRSLRRAWEAAIAGQGVEQVADDDARAGDPSLRHALATFPGAG